MEDITYEWAALATKSGKSAHEGKGNNRASISYQQMAALLQQAREMRLRGR